MEKVTITDAARITNRSASTIASWIKKGMLNCEVESNGIKTVSRADILKLANERPRHDRAERTLAQIPLKEEDYYILPAEASKITGRKESTIRGWASSHRIASRVESGELRVQFNSLMRMHLKSRQCKADVVRVKTISVDTPKPVNLFKEDNRIIAIPDGYEFDRIEDGKVIFKKSTLPDSWSAYREQVSDAEWDRMKDMKDRALFALFRLLCLRDAYNGDWSPRWSPFKTVPCIVFDTKRKPFIQEVHLPKLLAFKSMDICNLFFKNFQQDINQVAELLS